MTASSGRSGPTTAESRRQRHHRSMHFCRAPREGNYGRPASRSACGAARTPRFVTAHSSSAAFGFVGEVIQKRSSPAVFPSSCPPLAAMTRRRRIVGIAGEQDSVEAHPATLDQAGREHPGGVPLAAPGRDHVVPDVAAHLGQLRCQLVADDQGAEVMLTGYLPEHRRGHLQRIETLRRCATKSSKSSLAGRASPSPFRAASNPPARPSGTTPGQLPSVPSGALAREGDHRASSKLPTAARPPRAFRRRRAPVEGRCAVHGMVSMIVVSDGFRRGGRALRQRPPFHALIVRTVPCHAPGDSVARTASSPLAETTSSASPLLPSSPNGPPSSTVPRSASASMNDRMVVPAVLGAAGGCVIRGPATVPDQVERHGQTVAAHADNAWPRFRVPLRHRAEPAVRDGR